MILISLQINIGEGKTVQREVWENLTNGSSLRTAAIDLSTIIFGQEKLKDAALKVKKVHDARTPANTRVELTLDEKSQYIREFFLIHACIRSYYYQYYLIIPGLVHAMAKKYFKSKYTSRVEILMKSLNWLSAHIRNIRKRAYPKDGEEEPNSDVENIVGMLLQ